MAVISERFDTLGLDGEPVRLGLMGGTFDPIHIGHLRVAEEMRLKLGLDAVLFIPTGTPVFKRDQDVTDGHMRLEMCRLAVRGNPHFDVSSIEIDREGDTYTVDTLRDLRSHYPENVQLFFITGSDSAATVGKWRGTSEIAELASLAVAAGRPGSKSEDELREIILAAAPFDLHIVKASILEVSSTSLRAALQAGEPCRYFIPDEIRSYINEHGLYQVGSSRQAQSPDAAGEAACQDGQVAVDDGLDPLSKGFFKARKAELKDRVGAKRYEHSLNVSDTCVQLAKQYGVDVKKARIAGLLHDWDKGLDDDGARARVYELGMADEIDPYVVERMPRVLHGITAARALGIEFPGIPADVLQAISRHTTAAVDMSPLDMVLYIADAIEPGRQFGRIDELRAVAGKVTLDELYFQTYEYWVFLLFERRKTLHPDTIRIWNSYAAQLERGKSKSGEGSISHAKGKRAQ